MPVDFWQDIWGESCQWCGNPATHYFSGPVCCDCHAGKGAGLISLDMAKKEHAKAFFDPHYRVMEEIMAGLR